MVTSGWVPRLTLGAVAIGVLAAIISISVGEGGPQPIRIKGIESVQRLVAGIPQDEAYLGPADAELTITVFNDLQCVPCAGYQVDTVDRLIERYVRSGKARLELRHWSVSERATTLGALAAVAAAEQDREWQYAALFFRNQELARARGEVDEELLRELAEVVPELDVDRWADDRDGAGAERRVEADVELGASLELAANPAVVVSGPGGQRELPDAPTLKQIEAAIADLS